MDINNRPRITAKRKMIKHQFKYLTKGERNEMERMAKYGIYEAIDIMLSGIYKNYESKPHFNKYEIWVGYNHMGQGSLPATEPNKLAEVEAPTFKIACWLYELESLAQHIRGQMVNPGAYIEDAHFGTTYYNPQDNSNSIAIIRAPFTKHLDLY